MTDEERIRQLAYSIWEVEGRPEGQQQCHWDRAVKIVATERAAGNEAALEEVGDPLDETPIFEDDLPLEEDEMGIQENRLPLDDPDSEPPLDEAPSHNATPTGRDAKGPRKQATTASSKRKTAATIKPDAQSASKTAKKPAPTTKKTKAPKTTGRS